MRRVTIIFIIMFCLGIALQAIEGKWQVIYKSIGEYQARTIVFKEDGIVMFCGGDSEFFAGIYRIENINSKIDGEGYIILTFEIFDSEFMAILTKIEKYIEGVGYAKVAKRPVKVVPIKFRMVKLNE